MEKVQKWKYTKHLANEEKYSNNYSRKRDREKFINLMYYEAEVNLVLGSGFGAGQKFSVAFE